MEIRGFTIKCSKWKAKNYRDEEISLHKKVNDLQAKAENNPHNRAIVTIKRMCVLDYLHFLITNRNRNTITSARICLEFHVPFENTDPLGFEFL